MKPFDLLIKNGYLVDAANGCEGRFDIALAADRVERVEPDFRGLLSEVPGVVDTLLGDK